MDKPLIYKGPGILTGYRLLGWSATSRPSNFGIGSDVAARSHLYAYIKISSSWGHKKQNIMRNEKLNKTINSMSLLLATPVDEQDHTL